MLEAGPYVFGVLGLCILVWAIIELVNNFSRLPTWAQVLGIVGLFCTGGIMTLLVVYFARK